MAVIVSFASCNITIGAWNADSNFAGFFITAIIAWTPPIAFWLFARHKWGKVLVER